MEYWLSKNPDLLNFFLNHSKVYPNIAPDGAGYLDTTEFLKRDDVCFFCFGHGAVVSAAVEGGVFLDAYFLKRKNVKRCIESAIEELFKSGVGRIIAEAPAFNARSRAMIVSLRFKKTGVKPGAWVKNGVAHDLIQYELENTWEA